MPDTKIRVNRAPVLTLWASVVAERLGYDRDEALTLGQAVAGMNAYAKGRRLGIYEEKEPREKVREETRTGEEAGRAPVLWIPLCGREVPAIRTPRGLRGLNHDRPGNPERVEAYLAGKFGDRLPEVRRVMEDLADSLSPDRLQDEAFDMYAEFRPPVPGGKKGWGAAGELDLERIRSLAGGPKEPGGG